MQTRDLSVYHERTRTRGVNRPLYWLVRAVVQPCIQLWFWLGRVGREHVPTDGPVILASNHRSFLDPWVVGICVRRPVYFVAKRELFENRLLGWFLNSLGAIPIRRGESDEEAMATARAVLERGDALVIFPEGTRIRTGPLGEPKRGVGRLALETGAPIVPVAVIGTERARRGWLIRPCRVRVRCVPPADLSARRAPVGASRVRGDAADLAVRRAPVALARRRAGGGAAGRAAAAPACRLRASAAG